MNSDVFEISINLENKNSICSFNDVWYRMYEKDDEVRIKISSFLFNMITIVVYYRWMKYSCSRRKPDKI